MNIESYFNDKASDVVNIGNGVSLMCKDKMLINANSHCPLFFRKADDFLNFLVSKRIETKGIYRIPYKDIFFNSNFNEIDDDIGIYITPEYIYSSEDLPILGNLYVGEETELLDMPQKTFNRNGITLTINGNEARFTNDITGKEVVYVNYAMADELVKLNIYLPLIISMRDGDGIEHIVSKKLHYNKE